MDEDARQQLAGIDGDITDAGVFQAVRDGYDAVYDALPKSQTFRDIWRSNAYGADFPEQFAHIGFLTLAEGRRLLDLLQVDAENQVVDVACGHGGPGLWLAQEAGARVVGIDPSTAGLAVARARAARLGLADRVTFQAGTFERTGLPNVVADAVVTIEALQYAPDKAAAFAELHRILRPGGRIGIVCFEVDPNKVAGLPVLGIDPISDYGPLLRQAGFDVEVDEETPGWEERVYATFGALVAAADAIVADLGERAAAGTLAEAMLTVQLKPYPRRVLIVARRT